MTTAADVHAAAITACRDAGATCATCRWFFRPKRDEVYAEIGGFCSLYGEWRKLGVNPDHTCAAWQAATDAETAGEAPESPGEPRTGAEGTTRPPLERRSERESHRPPPRHRGPAMNHTVTVTGISSLGFNVDRYVDIVRVAAEGDITTGWLRVEWECLTTDAPRAGTRYTITIAPQEEE